MTHPRHTPTRRELIATLAAAAGLRPQVAPYALVLGAVQDGGLPQAGCFSPRCDRARRLPRYVASLALVDPDTDRYYLVDASPDLVRQMDLIEEPGFRTRAQARRPFDGIFLTHAHMGHYLGLALLGREGLGTAPTACYCSPTMAEYLTTNGPWSLMVREGRIFFPPVSFDTWLPVDDRLSVRLLPVPHRPEFSDTVAFIFRGPDRRLLYLPDIDSWEAWDRPIADVVGSVDVALLDGAFYSSDEVPGRSIEEIRHPLVPHTMDLLEDTIRGPGHVVFTHLNNTNPALDEGSPEQLEVRRRGFDVARAGRRFAL